MAKERGGFSFTSKSRYAIIALIDLARGGAGNVISIQDIAKTRGLSQNYVSRLVLPLRERGFIRSAKGPGGGYTLAMNPEDIRILDIVDLMDGPFHMYKCMTDPESCPMYSTCSPYPIWKKLDGSMRDLLYSLTLKQLLDTYNTEA